MLHKTKPSSSCAQNTMTSPLAVPVASSALGTVTSPAPKNGQQNQVSKLLNIAPQLESLLNGLALLARALNYTLC